MICCGWDEILKDELKLPYIENLKKFLIEERASGVNIYPNPECVFNAFKYTPFEDVKVVIIGQDPYHGPMQADGLCFSVQNGVKLPPSLRNIFSELVSDLNIQHPKHGCLLNWAHQGILMLNSILTVKGGVPLSHRYRGWERLTDVVVEKLYNRIKPIVFILWGKLSHERYKCILSKANSNHVVLKSSHPSPFSAYSSDRPFFGSRPFSKTNKYLSSFGVTGIDWTV